MRVLVIKKVNRLFLTDNFLPASEINVVDSSHFWFINFYSPNCHHCHELAPTWKKLASEFEGIVHIAAVNCEEDWVLCHQIKIHSYPTLMYYEKEVCMQIERLAENANRFCFQSHLYENEFYEGRRSLETLQQFILSQVKARPEEIVQSTWNEQGLRKKQWLLILCPEDSIVSPELDSIIKLTATFVSKKYKIFLLK